MKNFNPKKMAKVYLAKKTKQKIIKENSITQFDEYEINAKNFDYTEVEFASENTWALEIEVTKVTAPWTQTHKNFINEFPIIAFKSTRSENLTLENKYRIGEYTELGSVGYSKINIGDSNSWAFNKQEIKNTLLYTSFTFSFGANIEVAKTMGVEKTSFLINGSFFTEMVYKHNLQEINYVSIIFPRIAKIKVKNISYWSIPRFKYELSVNHRFLPTFYQTIDQNVGTNFAKIVALLPNNFSAYDIPLNGIFTSKTFEIPSNFFNSGFFYLVSLKPYVILAGVRIIEPLNFIFPFTSTTEFVEKSNYSKTQQFKVTSDNKLTIYGLQEVFECPVFILQIPNNLDNITPSYEIVGNQSSILKNAISQALVQNYTAYQSAYSYQGIPNEITFSQNYTSNFQLSFPIYFTYSRTTSLVDTTTIDKTLNSISNTWLMSRFCNVIVILTSNATIDIPSIEQFRYSPFSNFISGCYLRSGNFRNLTGEENKLIICTYQIPQKLGFISYLMIVNCETLSSDKCYIFPLIIEEKIQEGELIVERVGTVIYIKVKNYSYSFKVNFPLLTNTRVSQTNILLNPPELQSTELATYPSTFSRNSDRVVTFSGEKKRVYRHFFKPITTQFLLSHGLKDDYIDLNFSSFNTKTTRKVVGWIANQNAPISAEVIGNKECSNVRAEYFILNEVRCCYIFQLYEQCKMIRTPWRLKDKRPNISNYMIITSSSLNYDYIKILGNLGFTDLLTLFATTPYFPTFYENMLYITSPENFSGISSVIEKLTAIGCIVIEFLFPVEHITHRTVINNENELPSYKVYWKVKEMLEQTSVEYPLSYTGLNLIVNSQGILCDANGFVPLGPIIESETFICHYLLSNSCLMSKHISTASASHRMLPYGRSPGIVSTLKQNTTPITIGSETFPCNNFFFEDCYTISLTGGVTTSKYNILETLPAGKRISKVIGGTTYYHEAQGAVNSTIEVFFAWKSTGNDTAVLNYIKNNINFGYYQYGYVPFGNPPTNQSFFYNDGTSSGTIVMPVRHVSLYDNVHGSRGTVNGYLWSELPTVSYSLAFGGNSAKLGSIFFDYNTQRAFIAAKNTIKINAKFKKENGATETTIPLLGNPIENFTTQTTSSDGVTSNLKVLSSSLQVISSPTIPSGSIGPTVNLQFVIPSSTPYVCQGGRDDLQVRNGTYPIYLGQSPFIATKGAPPQNMVIYYKYYQGVIHTNGPNSFRLEPLNLKGDSDFPPEVKYNHNCYIEDGLMNNGFNTTKTTVDTPYWLDHTVNGTNILQTSSKLSFGYADTAVFGVSGEIN